MSGTDGELWVPSPVPYEGTTLFTEIPGSTSKTTLIGCSVSGSTEGKWFGRKHEVKGVIYEKTKSTTSFQNFCWKILKTSYINDILHLYETWQVCTIYYWDNSFTEVSILSFEFSVMFNRVRRRETSFILFSSLFLYSHWPPSRPLFVGWDLRRELSGDGVPYLSTRLVTRSADVPISSTGGHRCGGKRSDVKYEFIGTRVRSRIRPEKGSKKETSSWRRHGDPVYPLVSLTTTDHLSPILPRNTNIGYTGSRTRAPGNTILCLGVTLFFPRPVSGPEINIRWVPVVYNLHSDPYL